MSKYVDPTLKNVECGDWVFTIQHGWAQVTQNVDDEGKYPINIGTSSFTAEGRNMRNNIHPSIWTYNPFDAEDKPPVKLPDLKVDAKVFVRLDEGKKWVKRHFKSWDGNQMLCFVDGYTSFTTDDTANWKYWRLPEE